MKLIQLHELNQKYNDHYKTSKNFQFYHSNNDEFHPDHIAIEAPFWKNVQSMLKLGRVWGSMAAGLSREILFEYLPKN